MSDLDKQIQDLEAKADERELVALLASESRQRAINAQVARGLRRKVLKLKDQPSIQPETLAEPKVLVEPKTLAELKTLPDEGTSGESGASVQSK